MKRQKITYGVDGMMEFQAVIKVGKAHLKVEFTGGSFSSMSRRPATYTTDNFMVQNAIENSSEYKRGLIRKIRAIDLPGEVKVMRNRKEEAAHEALADEKPAEQKGEAPEGAEPTEGTDETDRSSASETHEKENGCETADEGEAAPTALRKIEVNISDDAREILEKEFGVPQSKMRTRVEIAAVAAQHGIEFVFAK